MLATGSWTWVTAAKAVGRAAGSSATVGVPIGEPHCVAIIDRAVGKRVIKYCPKAILMLAAGRCGGQPSAKVLFGWVKKGDPAVDLITLAVDLILPTDFLVAKKLNRTILQMQYDCSRGAQD